MPRDYHSIIRSLTADPALARAPREHRMQAVVDALWETLHDADVSWVGFYLAAPEAPAEAPLVLGPRRDKPACSPIGLQGVCGQSFASGLVRIVRDVAELGANYIACDPRDRSEIVLPLFETAPGDRSDAPPERWGVLDLDSWSVGAFDAFDAVGLAQVLIAAGFFTWTRAG